MSSIFSCATLAFLGIEMTMKILGHLRKKSKWEKYDENPNLAFRYLISSQVLHLHNPGKTIIGIGLLQLFHGDPFRLLLLFFVLLKSSVNFFFNDNVFWQWYFQTLTMEHTARLGLGQLVSVIDRKRISSQGKEGFLADTVCYTQWKTMGDCDQRKVWQYVASSGGCWKHPPDVDFFSLSGKQAVFLQRTFIWAAFVV